MTFDLQEVCFEPDAASEPIGGLSERLKEGPQPEEPPAQPVAITPDLIRRLARELSRAYGEDPDEQPFPFRHPRWRYHCARAKTLLVITPAEHEALAAVRWR